ncbi:uncharacterized protein [Palaemon carinicauda]|uniref:uncharacterized protein n=1 Tax=Palaemon carinicauda TaxID=392227 RepID=UPI0035B582D6
MIYTRTIAKVITAVGETKTFKVSVGLHVWSALSLFLSVLFLDMLSERIRNEELWELLYAYALVITAENEEELQRRMVEWQETLERGDSRENFHKTEARVSSKKGRGAVIKQMEQF